MVEVTLAWWLAQQPSLVGVHVEELMCELVALEAETAEHLWQKQIVFHETSISQQVEEMPAHEIVQST